MIEPPWDYRGWTRTYYARFACKSLKTRPLLLITHLTTNQLFPNFLLDKLLKKTSARQISKTASPVEYFRQALQQGCEASIKEIENLLSLLAEKKRNGTRKS